MLYELINHINYISQSAKPGIFEVLFIPYNDVQKLPDYRLLFTRHLPALLHYIVSYSDVQPTPGKAYFNIKTKNYFSEFIEKQKSSNAGEFFEVQLSLKLINIDEDTLQKLRSMHRKQFYVIIKERIDEYTLIGNSDSGADFSFERSSGKLKSSDSNEAIVKFNWQTEEPCFRIPNVI